ncbi:MAG: hypothetical protein K6357_04995 [Elusimicrobiota bacterium]
MKYWVYINEEIKGPFEIKELEKLEGFNNSTLVCPQTTSEEDTKEWKEAASFPELAAILSKTIGQSPEPQVPDSVQLPVSDKKEDVMIERFNANNLFSPKLNLEEEKTYFQSTDPLTLSQIRKRSESISQELSQTEISKQEIKDEQLEKKDEQSHKSPNQMPDETVKDQVELNIDDLKIPDSDLLISGKETLSVEPTKEQEPYQEVKKEVSEFNANVSEFKADIEEFKSEKADGETDKDISTINQSEVEKMSRYEISQEIASKIKEIEEKIVVKDEFEKFKNEIDILLAQKLASQQPSIQKEVLDHLEIEVKDLRVRIDMIEKKLSDLDKNAEPVPQELNLQSDTNKTKEEDKKDIEKTVIIKTESQENKKAPSDLPKKIAKGIGIIILLLAVAVSILFLLKQLGIFDFTKLLSQNKSTTALKQESANPPLSIPVTVSTQTDALQEVPLATQPLTINIPTATVEGQQQIQKDDIDEIIKEVKNYMLKGKDNLETTISKILASRKQNPSKIKWFAEEKDGLYIITAELNDHAKKTIFKFEFDPKSKVLKPLNTLSINTLKMMMQDEKVKKKVASNKNKPAAKEVKKKALEQKTSENKESGENISQETSQSSQSSEDEYLIIGE